MQVLNNREDEKPVKAVGTSPHRKPTGYMCREGRHGAKHRPRDTGEKSRVGPIRPKSNARRERSSGWGPLRLAENIARAWQTEMVPQCCSVIVVPEKSAPAQDRHHLFGEHIEPAL